LQIEIRPAVLGSPLQARQRHFKEPDFKIFTLKICNLQLPIR
jgi:hypothetical protein